MQDAVIAEVNSVVAQIIKPGMSDLEKEIAINHYLCSTSEYDYAALESLSDNNFRSIEKKFIHSSTPYGVLINKVGICASYAGAFKLLGEAAGLDVVIVIGNLNGNSPHAWNRVKIDGYWMTIDTTNNGSLIENAYFNIPDRISKGILVEDNNYIFKPVLATLKGTAEDLELYRVMGNYYSLSNLKSALAKGLRDGKNFLVRTDYDVSLEDVTEILTEAAYESGAEIYSVRFLYWVGVIYVMLE